MSITTGPQEEVYYLFDQVEALGDQIYLAEEQMKNGNEGEGGFGSWLEKNKFVVYVAGGMLGLMLLLGGRRN